MAWRYRLYKEVKTDDLNRMYEKISFKEVYTNEDGSLKGYTNTDLNRFAELDFPDKATGITQEQINNLSFLPIDENEVKEGLRFTLTQMLEALDQPVLCDTDFKGVVS